MIFAKVLDMVGSARYCDSCMTLTPHARTVDALLKAEHGITLTEFLDVRREQGTSYRGIATHLRNLTAGVVDVTGETIRNWIEGLEKAS